MPIGLLLCKLNSPRCSRTTLRHSLLFPLISFLFGAYGFFQVKENTDGSLNKYKARLVAKGFNQHYVHCSLLLVVFNPEMLQGNYNCFHDSYNCHSEH
ncbi:hypothetical protein CR513_34637, partial [Mucuna pruriens]